MRFFKLLALSIFLLNNYQVSYSQITSSDGLRLSGSFPSSGWWQNSHGQGGLLDMSIRSDNVGSKTVWKTSPFQERANPFPNNYQFKFASGGSGNPWANTWGDTPVSVDQISTLIYMGSNNASFSTSSDAFLFANWQDNGYANTEICILNLGANATGISSITEAAPPGVNVSSVDFLIGTDQPIDIALTNERAYAVYHHSGVVQGYQLLTSSVNDHGGIASSVADGTYQCVYVISTTNAMGNFWAGTRSLDNLMLYTTLVQSGTQFTVSSSCSSLTSGGSVSTPATTSGCASLNPDIMNNSAAASGGSGGTLNYLWEKSTDGGSTWVTANGTNAYCNPATISQTTLFRRGASRCATASVGGSEQYTSSVTFTVNANPSSVSVSGGGNTCGTRTLTASGGSGGTIYWQNTSSGGTSTSTATSSQDISATGTYYFRSRSSAGCWGTEGSASVTKNTSATISSQPGSLGSYSSNGSGTSNSVSATISNGSSPTYQWKYSSSSGGSYSAVSNGTPSGATYTNGTSASSFQVDGIDAAGTYYYKLYVTDTDDECSDPTSNEISLSVSSANSLPTTAAPTISPSSPSNSDDITASVGSQSDADSDPITIAYDWRIGGNSFAKKYLTFNSTSSSEVRDYSSYGSGENFTIFGSPTETTGISGNCYDFSGSGQYIRNQSVTPIDLNNGVSVSIWSNCDNLSATSNYQNLFILRDDAGGSGTQFMLRETGSGGMEAFVKTNGDFDWTADYIYLSSGQMTTNTWYHWVLTYDGANSMILYRNGIQIGSTTTTESGLQNIDDIIINGTTSTSWFSGKLDEFRLYTDVLTPAQVTSLYNSGTPQDNILKSDATSIGDVIDVYITPNDGTDDGTTRNLASTVTIPGPTIVTSGSVGSFTACNSVAGAEQNFTISGSNLTADITVTAPTGYEVSKTSGGSFSGSITFTPSSGTVASSSVYVRLTSSASNGASGNVACTSTGATTQNVATGSGSVYSAFNAGAINTSGENICNGADPANITSSSAASGGDGSITYQWKKDGVVLSSSNSATFDPSISDGAGAYTREAKDGTCASFTASTGTWIVTERSAFNAGAINTTGENICNGTDPANITSSSAASGGDGSITYQWKKDGVVLSSSNSATFDPGILDGAGAYTREAKDGTCVSFTASTGTWTVSAYNAFSAGTISSTGESYCSTGNPSSTITSSSAASGGDGSISYTWHESGGSAIAGETSATYTPTAAGTYTRKAADGTCSTSGTTSSGSWVVTEVTAPNAGTISGITSSQGSNFLVVGGSATLSTTGDGSGTWSSNNGNVTVTNSSTGAISGSSAGTSTITYTKQASPCTDATATYDITAYNDVYVNPIGLVNNYNTRYVGDKGFHYQFEINQSSWNATDVGVGTDISSYGSSMDWGTASWYADGSHPNKQVERNNSDYHFTSTGTYYVVGRGKKDASSPYAYTDETGWANDIELTSANATTITVSALPNPGSFAAANTDYQSTDLSWTNQTHSSGSGSYSVIVLRKTSAFSGADRPVNGTSGSTYNTAGNIGGATVVYYGSGTTLDESSLSAGTSYYYEIYSENYAYYSSGSAITVTTDAAPSISATASLSTFIGCAGSAGTEQSFTISGSNLVADITVTAPSGYEVSKSSGASYSGDGGSVTFSPSSGTVASSAVYVRLSSSASNGASGNIACTSTGATTVNEATGSGTVESAPNTQASSFSSSSVGPETATVSWTRGNGDKVLVIARASSAVATDPSNGSSYSANAAFGSGGAIGSGYVVYDGIGTSVNLTGLSVSTTYHFAIYEYETGNSCNLYNASQLTGNFTTATPAISTSASFSTFVSCAGSAGTAQSFTVSGSNLTTDITVTAPTGYEVSTDNSSFSSNVVLSESGGSVGSTTIYVRLTSSASNGASGNVACTSTGASTQNEATSSGTVHSTPGTQASSFTSSSVGNTTATVGWTRGNGDEVVVVVKASSAPSTDPTNGVSYTANAAFGSGDALSGGFVVYKGIGTSVNLTNLSNAVTYHIAIYEVETGNSCNLYNATQLTGNFTTSAPTIATSGSISSFTSCNGVAGAEQNFTVSGSNLTADITVTAPTGYEVSKTSGGSFSGSITFTPSSGTVASSSVYVRLTSSASNGASGNVACTSNGATTQNVATGSGTVTTAPNAGTLSGTQAVCSTGSTTFSTDGNAGGTWTSGTTGVATIDASSGAITPVSAGSSTITYTVSASPCADATATRVVTITTAPTSGTISGTNSMAIGQTSQLSISGNSASGTWGTSNASLATVSGSGLVTGVAAGSPNITYTVAGSGGCADATDTYAVTVTGTIATVGTGNWNDASNWGSGIVPTAGQDVTVLHDITVNTNTADLGNLTVNSGVTLSIGAYTVSVDGTYDATGGNTTFTDAGTLKLSGAVTDLGTFTKATNCTVEYDGGSQDVIGLNASASQSYYNLTINGSGTKLLNGNAKIYGDLSLTASDFDLNGNTIYPISNITRASGNLIAGSTSNITYTSGSSHNLCAFSDNDISVKTTGTTTKTITTTGNIDCRMIDLSNKNSTFLVDGETITIDEKLDIEEGTFQITSGTIDINDGTNDALIIVTSDAKLDIDGGTVNVGGSGDSNSELDMTNGTLEISAGTLNINDELDVADGTITQTGGTINIKNYVGSGNGTSTGKFVMDAGTLNLTSGTLRINGQTTTSASSNPAMSIAVGVTVNANANHTTLIQSNNTSSNDEDIYLNINGHNLGALSINLSGHEVYLQSAIGLEGNLAISAGDLQSVSAQTLTMSGGTQTISIAGGSVTGTDAGSGNDLTLAISSGSTTTFTGNATSNSDHEKKFFNVNVNSGATLELSRGIMCRYGTFTVDGDLQINDNGYVQSIGVSPTYGISSTLIYNSTGAFGRNHEWTSTSGAGYPNDVSVIQGSVNLGSGATSTARQIAGDLSISSGAGFYMDYGSDDMTAALTINGNISNSGTLSLSGSAGGDLVLKGDFAQNGTFNHNSRSVTLSGSSDQAISTTGSSVGFGFLTINNASNDIDPADDITVANDFTITAGELDLSSHTAMVTGTSDVNGTLTVSSGTFDANGTFDATGGNVTFSGAGRLELGGTVTSLGTFTGGGSSTVSYNGSGTQIIDDFSTKSGPYDNLDLDGGGQKDLSGNTTVNLVLSWSADCDMTTNGHTLTIKQSPTGYNDSRVITGGSSSTVSVAYSSSSTSECFIPVGINGDVRDISISAASATAETYTVVYTPGSPYGGAGTLFNGVSTGAPINSTADAAHVNNHYYYDISRSGSVNATLKLKFSGLTEPSDADKYVMHWNSGTSEWDQLSSTGASGYVTALATSFSPFTQGSGGVALPIDLVSFTGVCENNETELEFVVASQVNNDYFSIYRSPNATDWNLVGEIEGAGNTSTQMTYKWIDNNPVSGITYYRLSQTDYDGTSEMFSPIAVMCENTPVDGYSVYPNPANSVLNIDLDLDHYQGDDVSIEVIDINGKIVLLQQVQLNRGYNHLEVDLSETPSGVYMINFLGTRDYIKESRIIKQ